MTRPIEAIAVIVPAHDEEQLLGACLDSVAVSVRAASGRVPEVTVWAVLDGCRDGSPEIARRAGVRVIEIERRSVGAARAAGVRAALAHHLAVDQAALWTAHTDADSVVPSHWLAHQLWLACRGADVVVGTVRPDFRDLTAAQVAAWRATRTPGIANGHVHGANLGVRASALQDAGGFAAASVHEDVMLVDEMRRRGARIVASDGATVRTSGRRVGRAPDGYARYLREDLVPRAESLRGARAG